MKLSWCFTLVLATGCFFHVTTADAGDKKKADPPKKKKATFAPIIVNGELINADLKDKVYSASFCKTFTFKMEKGTAYQIELSSQNYRPAVRLESLGGQQIAAAIDQFGNRPAILLFTPSKTEDYQIVATTINGNATGKFNLTIRDASASLILSVADKLNANDKAYKIGNKKHKVFLAQLEAGKTYQIDMTSGSFDSYLFLESPAGKAITQDDDGGGYPSARIIYKATETGKFRVVTTHFGGGGNLGNFNLTIRESGGAPNMIRPFADKGFKDGK